VEAASEDWISVGVGWIAADAATAEANWPDASIDISVDGQPIPDTKRFTTEVEPFYYECPDYTAEGHIVKLSLYLPPLAPGNHTINWQYTIEATINDGWHDFEPGPYSAYTATVVVSEP
jgi:hypothetical protein